MALATLESNLRRAEGKPWQQVTERAEQIYTLFESVCPKCGSHAEITDIGGTREFHDHHSWQGFDGVPEVWEKPRGFFGLDDPLYDPCTGGITFKCENGHQHYVEYAHGDWH